MVNTPDSDTAPTVGDWALSAKKMVDSVNRVLTQDTTEADRLGKERVGNIKRLREVYDMSFFSLGPVYVHAGVGHDILAEFSKIIRTDFNIVNMRFSMSIFSGLPGWDNLLQAIPTSLMGLLDQFMATQGARNSTTGDYWRFRWNHMLIPDPLAVEASNLRLGEQDYRLKVYLPSGSKYQVMVPGRAIKFPVQPMRLPPDPSVLAEYTGGIKNEFTDSEKEAFRNSNKVPFGIHAKEIPIKDL